MSYMGCFQAKAELFEVAKHLFDPASSDIERERPGIGREVGQQIPWFRVLFVLTPSASELDRLVCQFRQAHIGNEETLSSFQRERMHLPGLLLGPYQAAVL